MIEYTWKVTNFKTADEGANKGAVVQVYWSKTGTDISGKTGTFHGATPLTSLNDAAGTFIPLAQVTEAKILEWIQAIVVGDYANHVDEQIFNQINKPY